MTIPPTLNLSAAPLNVWMPPGSAPVAAAGTFPVPLAAPFEPSQGDQLALAADVGFTEVTDESQAFETIAHTGVGVATTALHDEVIG